METLQIEILNPKAKRLIKDLADMNLISIKKNALSSFSELLKKLRGKASSAPSLDEITQEVELVRAKRYGK